MSRKRGNVKGLAERRLEKFKRRNKHAYDLIGRKPGPMKVKSKYTREKSKSWREYEEHYQDE